MCDQGLDEINFCVIYGNLIGAVILSVGFVWTTGPTQCKSCHFHVAYNNQVWRNGTSFRMLNKLKSQVTQVNDNNPLSGWVATRQWIVQHFSYFVRVQCWIISLIEHLNTSAKVLGWASSFSVQFSGATPHKTSIIHINSIKYLKIKLWSLNNKNSF